MANKQAVIIIHGIGEQRPMDTLRGFVKAVWETDESIHFEGRPSKTYSKPDTISGNLELRRLTTSYNKADLRTDFFEFYWAHLMEGNTVTHVWAWLKRLLAIGPFNLPKRLGHVWIFFLMLLIAGIAAVYGLFYLSKIYDLGWLELLGGFASIALLPTLVGLLENYIGDAARYLDSSPRNIKRRQEIRSHGIKILKDLHDSGEYNRIIVVGHSLGSVIAYDILIHAWPAFKSNTKPNTRLPKLNEIISLIKENKEPFDLEKYRTLQVEALKEQRAKGNDWLVSDLITLGSPLTYADVLLASDKKELDLKMSQREFPSCPPRLDNNSIIYSDKKSKNRQLTHDSLFALTRWTNVYFKSKWLIYGDIISGPLAPLFGKGVKDVAAETKLGGGRLMHTKYWKMGEDLSHVKVLREALDLTLDLGNVVDEGVVEVKKGSGFEGIGK